jgi:hypothetical protein
LAGSSRHFHRAIRKYGIETISTKVLWSGDSKEEACVMERSFIEKLNTVKMDTI